MNTLVTLGITGLVGCVGASVVAICSGHIPWLGGLLGAAPLEKEERERTGGDTP